MCCHYICSGPILGTIPGTCMFKRKLNTVSSKAQMRFISKKMAPLGLLAKSLARLQAIFNSIKPNCGINVVSKRYHLENGYENTSRIKLQVDCIRRLHFLDHHALCRFQRQTFAYSVKSHTRVNYAEVTWLTVTCHPISTLRDQKGKDIGKVLQITEFKLRLSLHLLNETTLDFT